VVHVLVARGAPINYQTQDCLDTFLRQHPLVKPQPQPVREKKAEATRAEWIPQQVHEHMGKGTLLPMDGSKIRQALRQGTLPAGWSPDFAWPSIQQRAEEHETTRHSQQQQQQLEQLKQERNNLDKRRKQLERELAEIKQQTAQLDGRIQQEQQNAPPPMADLSSLLEFAARVIPIEQELVGQLEAELSKKKPNLAALDDNTLPQQPKLSLMLNCMGIYEAGIAATSSLDLAQFARQTKRSNMFENSISSKVNRNTIIDLLYCGELARESEFPFVGHEDECPVCGNKTPEELVNFVKERGIHLNEEVLRQKEINGRRVLFCTKQDFPNQSEEQVHEAIDALQALHEEHL